MAFTKVRSLQESTVSVVGEEKRLVVTIPAAILAEAKIDPAKALALEVDHKAKPPLLALIAADADAHWVPKRKGKAYEVIIQELPAKSRQTLSPARIKISDGRCVINLPESWELSDDLALKG